MPQNLLDEMNVFQKGNVTVEWGRSMIRFNSMTINEDRKNQGKLISCEINNGYLISVLDLTPGVHKHAQKDAGLTFILSGLKLNSGGRYKVNVR